MAELSSLEGPTTEVDLGPKKIEEEKEGGPAFHCDLYDTEIVHKVAEALLPGLATACVDNTAGGLFITPGSVAADLRKEMIEYLTMRSESFVAELVVLEGGPDNELLDNPFEIISVFVDDFAIEKRNLFSRFSGWLLSERREDRIDDIVQEMEMNGFWTLERRQAIAGALVKNVDFKNLFHCDMKFTSLEELSNHAHNCGFRPIICHNQGCEARFCASHLEKHDSECPSKIIPCEQKCPDLIMRREMDRHCITKCPMKLVNCPFYAVGCRTPIAQCLVDKHRSDELHFHVLCVLKGIYKEASEKDLKSRVDQLVQESSNSRLAEARDVRFFTAVVKDLDSKLEPLVITVKTENDAENYAENGDSSIKEKDSQQSMQTSNEESPLDKTEVTVEAKGDAVKEDSNVKESNNAENGDSSLKENDSQQSIQTSSKENSSDKTEGNVEAKNDAVNEDSNIKEKDTEKNTQTPIEENSSNEVEITVEMENAAENDKKNEDSYTKEKDDEQSTQMSSMKNSSDKVEVRAFINQDSVEDRTNKEDNGNNKGNAKSIETSKGANSLKEAEVNDLNTAHVDNKSKNAADGSLKPEGNEESTKAK
ncbi:uncharacterized protein LOC129304978 isoform X2 [Prosopis cineraria]|uniref:uncharacterized protein LOC129304978 isoform X2 n=1 Tax=Prosopis cineraria TaxID=364024 RepID=UPI00240FCE81|nr:uncharacterized protein LOC129304978 isoform X2 [Prosopis cineraria]XP_054800842.1 uncharacterized protein LOC129304978 isoform X2 [Prosopis cineraria]XP_054800849.1 uncharacterized protein LOC129304978 isoform X2 [Prosopis cineraria]XP_054800858.1 uncharacterized protein LOC129304978 isoform X2 [Prosopis cineraria]XP_054800866.1 uncharacterized protein LOC129304978 isoform X2 [Prosopis cineraria]